MENQKKFASKLFKSVTDDYPSVLGDKLLYLKSLIYEQAELNPKVGEIEESLKWGQLSYASKNRSGTPVRLGIEKKSPGFFGLYVNCSTTVIDDIKHIYGDRFQYDGNRGLLFNEQEILPEDEIRHAIDMTLCYHINKKRTD